MRNAVGTQVVRRVFPQLFQAMCKQLINHTHPCSLHLGGALPLLTILINVHVIPWGYSVHHYLFKRASPVFFAFSEANGPPTGHTAVARKPSACVAHT